MWAKVGQRIAKRPRVVWVVTTIVLLGLRSASPSSAPTA